MRTAKTLTSRGWVHRSFCWFCRSLAHVVSEIIYGFRLSALYIVPAGMGHGDKYEDNSLDVFHYFNSSCYKGFGDDEEVQYRRTDEGIW